MDEFLDTYLGKVLKSWSGRQKAPGHLRGRILWLAAHPPLRVKGRDFRPINQTQVYQPAHWEHLLLTCDILHSTQNGLTVSRMVL